MKYNEKNHLHIGGYEDLKFIENQISKLTDKNLSGIKEKINKNINIFQIKLH